MAQNSTIVIPNSVMEELFCSMCIGYLSCAPLRLLADGSRICGRCSPPSDVSVARDTVLEAVLNNASFPCCYKLQGCTKLLLFGKAIDHESTCTYRSFACPSPLLLKCSWKGPMVQLLDHFTTNHFSLVKQKTAFEFQVNQNGHEVFLIRKNNAVFIVKYYYDANETNLSYDIRFCTNSTARNASYNIRVVNGSDPELYFNLKTDTCCVFDNTFYGVKNLTTLNISKFLPGLDNPERIEVSINLVVQYDNTGLDTLRCGKCHNFLVPPLFDLDGGAICSDCAKVNKNCKPLDDAKLLWLVATADYPCRWQNCEVVARASDIRAHELKCTVRQHDCFYGACNATFTLNDAIEHYHRTHRAHCLTNSFQMSFSSHFGCKHIICVKNSIIVLFQYHVEKRNGCNTLCLMLYTSEKVTCDVVFEHNHCKLKSKPFTVDTVLYITLDQLPPCFKENHDLKGTVII